MNLSFSKIKKLGPKYDSKNLFLNYYDYDVLCEDLDNTTKKRLDDRKPKKKTVDTLLEKNGHFVDIEPMSLLEGDEEGLKEGKRFKILTPNKLLTRLPVLLAQIKAGNNSHKLKYEIKLILYLLYQHKKITKKVYNNLNKSLQQRECRLNITNS